MNVEIRPVTNKSELKHFVSFGNDLYKLCPKYCPPLYGDELDIFDKKKNPALEVSEYQLFLAYTDGQIVGRIAGIINHRANEHWHNKKVRFGWFDFIDDTDISRALLDAVRQWGKQKGMEIMNGPVGFTDLDKEGLLIQGYEYLAPLASLYNYPYYIHHYEEYGLKKETDWIEYRITVPDALPDRVLRLANVAKERFHLRVDKVKNVKELLEHHGYSFFDVMDAAYSTLYNAQPLTDKQKKYYSHYYFPILNFDFVTLVVNEKNEIVGVGLGMPDISEAVRKCGGKLFPWGWLPVLKALKAKKMEIFDLLIIAVRPDYQGKGVNAVIIDEMFPYFAQYGIKYLETTSILEDNHKNQANWLMFNPLQHKRRRAYIIPV